MSEPLIAEPFKGTRTYIRKLNDSELAKIGQTVMRRIFVHNQGDILHRFGAKPTRHDFVLLSNSTKERNGGCFQYNHSVARGCVFVLLRVAAVHSARRSRKSDQS